MRGDFGVVSRVVQRVRALREARELPLASRQGINHCRHCAFPGDDKVSYHRLWLCPVCGKRWIPIYVHGAVTDTTWVEPSFYPGKWWRE